ncbi:MAG: RtcB family protein [Elusimicrobia bacterium]|nr:RtcB family protein [Elusimicrobiota bacterium]
MSDIKKVSEFKFEIPPCGAMKVPGVIYASEKMIRHIERENVSKQIENVAALPGILKYSLAMPDVHWGYGMPIGGVAAMDIEKDGVVSPGAIGYDINCGVRLLRTNFTEDKIREKLRDLLKVIFRNIPSGVGSRGKLRLTQKEVGDVLEKGSVWAVERGFGTEDDISHTEEGGCLRSAKADFVSNRALERGNPQLGTLGAGNHFLEIQKVVEIYDEGKAKAWGIFPGQITVMIHTGSRGLGYQVCDDYLKVMQTAVRKYGISLADRQLACAPFESEEGRRYFAAMCAAANYAWCNRQIITHRVRESFMEAFGAPLSEVGLELVWDVAHNIGKIEEFENRKIFIHRKGATRAFPAGRKELPEKYRSTGQPVIVPGSMGTASYLLVGEESASQTFYSTCHGAGREMSRKKAMKLESGQSVVSRLKNEGILVLSDKLRTVAEEAPAAYKEIDEVVEVCDRSGISKKVAKMVPLGVIKG